MAELEDMIQVILENGRECDVCIYRNRCPKGVSGGPRGPMYPPCSDGDYERLADEDRVNEVYAEITDEVGGNG